MAYNKTKHLDAAHKYLQQGKLPQAIAEYQQILKNEPKDQVTLMTLNSDFVLRPASEMTFQGYLRVLPTATGEDFFERGFYDQSHCDIQKGGQARPG